MSIKLIIKSILFPVFYGILMVSIPAPFKNVCDQFDSYYLPWFGSVVLDVSLLADLKLISPFLVILASGAITYITAKEYKFRHFIASVLLSSVIIYLVWGYVGMSKCFSLF